VVDFRLGSFRKPVYDKGAITPTRTVRRQNELSRRVIGGFAISLFEHWLQRTDSGNLAWDSASVPRRRFRRLLESTHPRRSGQNYTMDLVLISLNQCYDPYNSRSKKRSAEKCEIRR
jgi:hypothetical protein